MSSDENDDALVETHDSDETCAPNNTGAVPPPAAEAAEPAHEWVESPPSLRMRRLGTPTRRTTWLHPLSRGILTLLAAVSVASARGAAAHAKKQIEICTGGRGQDDTPTARHTPLELLLLLLLLRVDMLVAQGAPNTRVRDAADPTGGGEAALC